MKEKLQKHLQQIAFTNKEISITQEFDGWVEFNDGSKSYTIDLTKTGKFKKDSIRLGR